MIIQLIRATCFPILILSILAVPERVTAQDWPQILGPQRNGVVENQSLLLDWPAEGLTRSWKKTVGQGYAGPIVQDDSVVIFHRVGKELVCERLSAATGDVIWKVSFPANYEGGGIDNDLGPKAVPLYHDGKVILYSPSGNLFCLNFEDGSTQWTRSALTEYKGREGYFGAGSSPVVAAGNVVVNVGGREAGLVAFRLSDGSESWKSVDDQASYSSPILSRDGEVVIAITRFKLVGVDARTGAVRFEAPFGKRGPTVNAAMPVLVNDHLLVTAAYQIGARWFRLAEDMNEIEEVWSNNDSYSSQFSTPVFHEGHFYGTAGREDSENGSFRCFEAKTGAVKWSVPMPVGHTLLVDGRLLHIDTRGKLHIIQTDPRKYREQYQTDLFPVPTRCLPAISNGRLFVRSNAMGPKGQLACFVIGKSSLQPGD